MPKEPLIFIAIIFLSILFEFVGWFDGIRIFGQKLAVPATSFNTRIVEQISRPYDYLQFIFIKSKYMKQLEENYAKSLSELNKLDALEAENEELKRIIGANGQQIERTVVSAPIISLAYPAVGVGIVDGVQEKDMVIASGVLLGTIEKVTQYQSKVSLLTSKRKDRILAITESGIEGVIDSDGRNVLLTHIPRSFEVNEGERVMTIGQEGIEKNVLIGTIQKIDQDPSAATQTFIVSQIVSFYNSVLVEVK